MHPVSTNQIANIQDFNDNVSNVILSLNEYIIISKINMMEENISQEFRLKYR